MIPNDLETSNDGPIPQIELGPHIGGMKILYQRAGSLVFQPVTMVGAMTSAWATSETVRMLFLGSPYLYFGAVGILTAVAMVVYYVAILPSEQGFNQGQAQRAERSPLKRDTESILTELDALNDRLEERGLELDVSAISEGDQ